MVPLNLLVLLNKILVQINLSSYYLDKAEMLRDTYRHFYTHLPGKVACTLYSALFIEKTSCGGSIMELKNAF